MVLPRELLAPMVPFSRLAWMSQCHRGWHRAVSRAVQSRGRQDRDAVRAVEVLAVFLGARPLSSFHNTAVIPPGLPVPGRLLGC